VAGGSPWSPESWRKAKLEAYERYRSQGYEDCWPSLPLLSTYFVQCEGDVVTLRGLVDDLAEIGVGISSNVESMQAQPRVSRLMGRYIDHGAKVYVDSGVYPRFKRGQGPPDFDRVMDLYAQLVERASLPGQVSVTAPDVIGDARATLALQRRYGRKLMAFCEAESCRLVVPVQGGDARSLVKGIEDAMDRFPGSYVGVPVRAKNTTPLAALLEALLIIGRRRGGGPSALPPIHFLGLGSSERIAEHVSRLAALYRVLSGPKVWKIVREREEGGSNPLLRALRGRVQSPEQGVAAWLGSLSMKQIVRLAGCVQTRQFFPCPPDPWGGSRSRPTFGGSHPAVDRVIRDGWKHYAGERAGWPARRLVGERDLNPPDWGVMRLESDAYTKKITGIDGLSINWYLFMQSQWERTGIDVGWGELCLDAIEDAEDSDPAMVEGAWGADDLDALIEHGGADRIQMDATTVSAAASSGAWIVGGTQQARTTPAWWRAEPKRFRFLWNLRETVADRAVRERLIEYHWPRGYDQRGFY